MNIMVTFMIEGVEEDTNISEFAEKIVSDVGDHIIPYHDVTFVEVEAI